MILNKSDSDSIEKTVAILRSGGVAILPTDTVYGFSALVIKDPDTAFKIRQIKGRDENKPFIQLISKPEDIFLYSSDKVPEKILSYWPGPLTVILNDKRVPGATTAFRCPGDPWLREVISRLGFPVYSTSVNRSGSPVLTRTSEIIKEFEKDTDLIVLDGDSESSVPSTIVKLEGDDYVVLRKGAVSL